MQQGMRVETTQRQQQTLSFEQIQAFKLLECPFGELSATVEKAATENLFVNPAVQMTFEDPDIASAPARCPRFPVGNLRNRANDAGNETAAGTSAELPPLRLTFKPSAKAGEAADRQRLLEEHTAINGQDTLEDHLRWQLGALRLPAEIEDACELIIDSLDERGFIPHPEALREALHLEASLFAEALSTVQSLSPVGVARESIRECLLAQLAGQSAKAPCATPSAAPEGAVGKTTPALAQPAGHAMLTELQTSAPPIKREHREALVELLEKHWDDLMAQRFARIRRAMGLSQAQLQALLRDLGTLTLYPSCGFAGREAGGTLVFDIVFTLESQDEIQVEVAGDRITEADIVDLSYESLLDRPGISGMQRDALRDQRRQAFALARGIVFRNATLARLGLYLARKQRAFFLGGRPCLVPLTMQEAADELRLSISAISRAVKDKYAYTPQGPIPLRDFFAGGLEAPDASSGKLSQAAVKDAIARAIGAEDPQYPLSDLELCEMLRRSLGVDIARRTVSKYRNSLGIPSQTRRRALFAQR